MHESVAQERPGEKEKAQSVRIGLESAATERQTDQFRIVCGSVGPSFVRVEFKGLLGFIKLTQATASASQTEVHC